MPNRDASSVLLALSVTLPLIAAGVAIGPAVVAPTAATAGPTLVGVQGPGMDGKVVRTDGSGDTAVLAADAGSYHDVSALPNGSILAAYAVGGQQDCGPYEAPCGRTGVRVLHPDTGEIQWQWSYPVRTMGNSEVHDAEYLPGRGELLVVGMDRERVFTVDMDSRGITWQWNASDHYGAPEDPTRVDWLHMNDVDRIGDGRYLVSVRNENQLVIVNRSCTCVTEVVNEDGDPQVMRGQHNPQWLGDGRVLVADSSNDRVVELARDDSTGEWDIVWARARAGGQQFSWPRDADRLPNGHTLITDSRNHRIVELNSDGELVAEVRTPKLPYEADRVGQEYPAGPPLTNDIRPAADGERGLPVFQTIRVGLHHSIGLPPWVSDVHLAVWWVSLTFGGIGLVLRWRDG